MQNFIANGRLSTSPIVTRDKQQKAIANFRIAIPCAYRSSDFINCVAFGEKAEFVATYLKKGMKVHISGKIRTGSYEKEGFTIPTIKVFIHEIEFGETKAENAKYNTANREDTSHEEAESDFEDDMALCGIDGTAVCPECGCIIADTDRNCAECGAKL